MLKLDDINPDLLQSLISTVLLFLGVGVGRWVAINSIRKWSVSSADFKRRWIVQVKNLAFGVLVFGLFLIWATELRNFALSLVAVAAAVAISAKELILCMMGGVYKASTKPFDVGDRIIIGHMRGDVLDHDLLSTKLFEVGPGEQIHQYTGRTITVPNSQFLSTAIINESQEKYLLHTFTVPVAMGPKWDEQRAALLKIAQSECASFLPDARRYMERLAQREGFDVPSVEPRVSVHIPEPETIHLIVRIPTPGLKTGRLEQNIVTEFLKSVEIPEPERRPLKGN